MARSLSVMSRRLGKLGVTGFEIHAQGSTRIVIEGLRIRGDRMRAIRVVAATGQLQIFDLESSLTGPSVKSFVPQPLALYPLLEAVASEAKAQGASSYYLFDKKHKLVAGPVETRAGLLQGLRSTDRPLRPGDTILGVPESTAVVACDRRTSRACLGSQSGFVPKVGQTWYYLFRLPPQLTGNDLNADGISADFGSDTGPFINLSFTGHGNKVFHEITRAEYQRGQTYGAQHFAIVLNGWLITFPQIDPMNTSLSDGIDPATNGAIIQGIGSVNEAKDIATVLQTGALPARFEIVRSRIVRAAPGS
jgi:SecD/SecF fusion protein